MRAPAPIERPPEAKAKAPAPEGKPPANVIRFRMKPDDVISMSMQAKVPGDGLRAQGVDLTVDYGEALGGDVHAYVG